MAADSGEPVRLPVTKRLELVEEVFLRLHGSDATKRYMRRKYGVAYRTTDRDLARLRTRWNAETKATREHVRAEHRRRLQAFAARAERADRWSAALSALRLLAEIDGVRAAAVYGDDDRPFIVLRSSVSAAEGMN